MNSRPSIREVLTLYPSISAEGYGIYLGPVQPLLLNKKDQEWIAEMFEEKQTDIFSSSSIVERVYDWMADIEKSDEIYYSLKSSDLADFMKMIPQVEGICLPGAFIVAALQRGFEMEAIGEKMEVCFNFDVDSLRRALPENLRRWVQ